jgi:pimeloyl-ACP methyl ester carboxylesterase
MTGRPVLHRSETAEVDSAIGGFVTRGWRGAKQALRTVSYFQMDDRAKTIGRTGLAPLLNGIAHTAPDVGVYLVAHSMGARLVVEALDRIAKTTPSMRVDSVVLLQGAVPAVIFAGDGRRPPRAPRAVTVASFSGLDTTMKTVYPLARLGGLGVEAASSAVDPHQALGYAGFQGVEPHTILAVHPVGSAYPFRTGQFYSIDCERVVSAHADILHVEIARLVLQAMSVHEAGLGSTELPWTSISTTASARAWVASARLVQGICSRGEGIASVWPCRVGAPPLRRTSPPVPGSSFWACIAAALRL